MMMQGLVHWIKLRSRHSDTTPQQEARADADRQTERARAGRYAWPCWSGRTYEPLTITRQQRRHTERKGRT